MNDLFFTFFQDRSKAARYQLSPDMKHVMFAFDVKRVKQQ